MKARFHKGLLFSNIPVLCLLSRVNTMKPEALGLFLKTTVRRAGPLISPYLPGFVEPAA